MKEQENKNVPSMDTEINLEKVGDKIVGGAPNRYDGMIAVLPTGFIGFISASDVMSTKALGQAKGMEAAF